MNRKQDKRNADTDVLGQVVSERIRMHWEGADKSGRHFCASIAVIGKPGVKLVSLLLWFHAQRSDQLCPAGGKKGSWRLNSASEFEIT